MPDYSFIAQPKVPEGFQTLGNMVNTAKGLTELQKSRATLEADIAQRKSESSKAGTEATLAAETLQPRIEQQTALTSRAKTEALGSQFKLEGEQSAKAMAIAGGLIQDKRITGNDPNGIIDAANEAYSQMVANGVPKNTADFWASQLKAQSHQPGAALRLLQNVTRANAGSAIQAGVINAPLSPVQTQQGTQFQQLQPGAEGAVQPGTGVSAGVAPTSTETSATDALGRPIIQKRDQNGGITFAPTPGSNYKPLMTLPPGETKETAAPLLALRDQAQAAASAVPAQRFNNDQILKLSDSAFTGTGSEGLAKALNAVGLQKTNDAGADTAKLQHFIGLQIQQNASSMGANTDAARQLAAQAVLPGSSPAQAIKAITRINDAYAVGTELFNRGIAATMQNPNNQKDVFAIRDFQNAWTANFDPRITLLENAQKDGNKAEVDRIKKELGQNGIQTLLKKAQNLQRLIHQGAVGGP